MQERERGVCEDQEGTQERVEDGKKRLRRRVERYKMGNYGAAKKCIVKNVNRKWSKTKNWRVFRRQVADGYA